MSDKVIQLLDKCFIEGPKIAIHCGKDYMEKIATMEHSSFGATTQHLWKIYLEMSLNFDLLIFSIHALVWHSWKEDITFFWVENILIGLGWQNLNYTHYSIV